MYDEIRIAVPPHGHIHADAIARRGPSVGRGLRVAGLGAAGAALRRRGQPGADAVANSRKAVRRRLGRSTATPHQPFLLLDPLGVVIEGPSNAGERVPWKAAWRRLAVAAIRMSIPVGSAALVLITDAFTRNVEAVMGAVRLADSQSARSGGIAGSQNPVGPKRMGPPINSHGSGGLVPHAAAAMHPLRAIRELVAAPLTSANAKMRHVEPARRL